MNFISLIILLLILGAIIYIVRSIIRAYRGTAESPESAAKFPVFSIAMLSIALILLIAGTWMSLTFSDTIGGAIAALGGVFGTIESHVRHKREAVPQEVEDAQSSAE